MTLDERLSNEIEDAEAARSMAWADEQEAEAMEANEHQDIIEQHNIKPEFHVTDESSADWVLRKIAEARAGRKRVEAQLAAKVEAYRREEEYFTMRYQNELRIFAFVELDGKKTKTLKLAEGSLSFRVTPPKLVVRDESLALAWATINAPNAIKATMGFTDYFAYRAAAAAIAVAINDAGIDESAVVINPMSLAKSVLNERFKAGEIPDGCDVEPAGEVFSIQ